MEIWVAELKLALEVPRWTWRFYLRHLPLIAGLSLIPSTQRLIAVNWGIPGAWAAASEVVVMVVRVGLVLAVGWLALRGGRATWERFTAFATAHWRSLVWQGVLLGVAFLVFDVVAETIVGGLLPAEARQGYQAVLLFVKNPTIIALTLVWWVGLVRRTSWATQERPVAV
ncbi:hypothetical protein AB0I60_27540 [Actinosynnema sp. NPDC050436]|uniref:hypothetical protein n=1 Tax=Actinosynnema sp. NPDC050436 TaxID=3155659 RepID=UPI0033FADFE1